MLAAMKHEKMTPCGMRSPLGLSAGVHRNTKLYIAASNSDCITPSSTTRVSAFVGAGVGVEGVRTRTGGGEGLCRVQVVHRTMEGRSAKGDRAHQHHITPPLHRQSPPPRT